MLKKNSLTTVEAGRKGGETTRQRHGPDHYSRIGKLGGEATKAKGPGYYAEIGRKGGSVPRKPRTQGA